MPQKTDICGFCGHQWDMHHKGCHQCHAIPATHGNFCEGALCCCVDFATAALSDEDVEMLMGETA